MANVTKPLTNTEVKQSKAKEKEYNLADGEGLALRVKPSGQKFWIFNYSKPFTKKRTNIGFGTFPRVSLAEARQKRKEARELLSKNIDPKIHKEELYQQNQDALASTFGKVAEKWLVLKRQQVKEETANKAWQTMVLHVLPQLADVPIHVVKPKLVIDILSPIANKGSLETVKRLCRNINEVMRLAVASGLIEVNYLADITKLFAAPKKTNMATIKPERLPELMAAISETNLMRTTRCLVHWQLHTMTRPLEAASARWQDIDLANKVWVIPAERMKMKKPHTIPLTKQALALLEVIRSMSGRKDYLFTNHRDPTKHASSQSVNTAVKRGGFAGELVSHGLRSLASTTLNEKGFDFDIIEAALAHQDSNSVRRAYNHAEYIERRRVMMNWWSEHIERCSKGDYSLMTTDAPLRLINE